LAKENKFGIFFFCRQYLPDSTIPLGLAKQADVAFLWQEHNTDIK
jgi:hypothetical protein